MADMSFGQMAGLGGIAAGGNIIGGVINHVLGSKAEKEMWERNYNAQKEFAQNSIQWRVQDAQKAGIHPLYAMGNSPGYTPSSSMDTGALGQGVANAGNAFAQTMGQLQMQNAYLQNAKLAQDVESAKNANRNKELQLYNKMVSLAMGQKSAAMPHVTGQGEQDLYLSPSGHAYILPNQMESEIASLPADLRKIGNTMYNRSAVEAIPTPKGMKKAIMWSPLGYSHKFYKSDKDLGLLDKWAVTNDYLIEKAGKAIRWFADRFFN